MPVLSGLHHHYFGKAARRTLFFHRTALPKLTKSEKKTVYYQDRQAPAKFVGNLYIYGSGIGLDLLS
jgi:hypothetical protein